MKLKAIIQIFRPHQWVKNGFIFLPLFFNGQLGNLNAVYNCLIAFVSFSLAASSIYCFNDIYDVEADRQHPEKRQRPVASKAISIPIAYMLMLFCLLLSILTLLLFNSMIRYELLGLIGFYYLMNIAYCIVLKRFSIVDVIIISFGFVLRILAGGFVTGIPISEWIVILTFLLALFLAFAKRRDDVIIFQSTGVVLRKNTGNYNLDFINQVMTVIATITIVAYIIYTISPEVTTRFHCQYIYPTAVFVLAGIIRYLQITIVRQQSGDPTKIFLRDRFIQICILGWLIAFLVIIYLIQ
jgi:4-hydroxybenzoate polyprenyltransferase